MKTMTRSLALASVALLGLTACGGDQADTEAAPEPDENTEQPADSPEGTAEAQDETPAASEDDTEAETEDSEPIDNEGLAPKDMDFSDDPILSDREFTGRMTGDVVAGMGEPVEIDEGTFEGIGDYMGTLTLDGALAGLECTTSTDEVIEPQGELLVVDMTISADAEADSEFYVSHGDFRWVGHDGEIGYYEMYQCTSALNSPSVSVRPGETAQRTFLFDVPGFEGELSYTGATNYVDFEIERSDYDNAENLPEA